MDSEIRPTSGQTLPSDVYRSPGSPPSGPCTVWTTGVSTTPPSTTPSGPLWSLMTSKSPARSKHESAWRSSNWVMPIISDGASSKIETSSASVLESPEAKSVTSCPAPTRPSARSETIHSIPP